jgi:hypothetical protein
VHKLEGMAVREEDGNLQIFMQRGNLKCLGNVKFRFKLPIIVHVTNEPPSSRNVHFYFSFFFMVFQLKTHLKVRFSSISSFRLLARCERSKTETIILASVFQQYSFTLAYSHYSSFSCDKKYELGRQNNEKSSGRVVGQKTLVRYWCFVEKKVFPYVV